MDSTLQINKKVNRLKGKKRLISRLIFALSLVILPLIQFCIFYIYVNVDMLVLAFQKYTPNASGVGYDVSFVFLDNFKTAFGVFTGSSYMIKNSLIKYFVCTLLGMCLSIIFSFYLYKQYLFSGFFKVILFMPQIISSLVFALLFKYIVTDAYVSIVQSITGKVVTGLLDNPDMRFGTVIFFNLWSSFGVSIMLYTGGMNGINESVVESAQLDGANIFQEFIYITVPLIFSTIISMLVIGLVGIFTDQMHLYTLFQSGGAEMSTFGYFLYLQSLGSDVVIFKAGQYNYSELSALGILLTAIILPITLIIKKLLEKFGPSVD